MIKYIKFFAKMKTIFYIVVVNVLIICSAQLVSAEMMHNIDNNSASMTKSLPLHIVQNYCNNSLADIVEPLIPAVVNISVQYNKKSESSQKNSFNNRFSFDHFNEFFEQFNIPFNFGELYSDPKSVSRGSGFIIDPTGFIVTNYHLIANADEIHVKLSDDTEIAATLVGSDKETDLALLKIETKSSLPFVIFGDSAKARVGDQVIAIGNPFGRLGGTVTAGIISSKGRDIDISVSSLIDNFIQTDAAINSGNSGGPMFNVHGEVIGVNTAILSPSGTNVGIGFAIPANTAKQTIAQLKRDGRIHRGLLGVYIQNVTDELAEGLGLKDTVGALVLEVQKNGPADKVGIKSGDVIIEFAGQLVKNTRKLRVLVAETAIDQEVKIIVVRNGKKQELIGKVLMDNTSNIAITDKDSIVQSNIVFSNLTEDLRQKFDIKKNTMGVIVTSVAKNQKNYGFQIGDLLVATVNQQPITTIDQLNTICLSAKKSGKKNIVLLVQRRNQNIFIALPVI